MALPDQISSREFKKFTEVGGQPAVRVSVVEGGGGASSTIYALRTDQAGSTLYVGEAVVGSSESNPVWRIKRVVETGPDIAVTWAESTSDFDKVWADRLTYTYG